MPYAEARELKDDKGELLIQHPLACLDCHEPETMALRVTRPGFIAGIKALKAQAGHRGLRPEPRRHPPGDALVRLRPVPRRVLLQGRRQGRHVSRGPRASRSRRSRRTTTRRASRDWTHAETGAKVLKAQHPEFEMWNQGIHARAGVACADCHMPYEREGAIKVSDHWVRSPLLNINRACQPCHAVARGGAARAGCSPSRTGTTSCSSGPPRPPPTSSTPWWRPEGRRRGRRAPGGARAAAQGPVAARLRRRRELHGLPRAPGAGAHPGRGDRLRAPGPARGRPRRPEEMSEGQPVALLGGQDLARLPGYAAIALQVRYRRSGHRPGFGRASCFRRRSRGTQRDERGATIAGRGP